MRRIWRIDSVSGLEAVRRSEHEEQTKKKGPSDLAVRGHGVDPLDQMNPLNSSSEMLSHSERTK